MLRSIIICPDSELAERLQASLGGFTDIRIGRVLNEYPNAVDLIRTLRAQAPDIVFLSFDSVDKAHDLVRMLEKEADGIQIVALHRKCDATLLRETMRAGVREFLEYPFERQAVVDSLSQVKTLLERKPPVHEASNQMFSFLPSKAGVGTSTIALNVAAALARREQTRVVLSDFDLNSGMMRFMLKLKNQYSVMDAAENAPRMDEQLWPQLVTSFDTLDVLHAGPVNPNLRIDPNQIRSLVEFLRRNYQAMCFDHSGNLERYSIELMQESKRVLLVCTPEVPSLHLAREKLRFLRSFDLESRCGVILNRCAKKPLFTQKQVEELLGVPVVKMFPNDYQGVNRALTAGTWITPDSEMGKGFMNFANELLERKGATPVEPKRKFLEYFALGSRPLLTDGK